MNFMRCVYTIFILRLIQVVTHVHDLLAQEGVGDDDVLTSDSPDTLKDQTFGDLPPSPVPKEQPFQDIPSSLVISTARRVQSPTDLIVQDIIHHKKRRYNKSTTHTASLIENHAY